MPGCPRHAAGLGDLGAGHRRCGLRLERGASYEDIAARLGKPTPNAARVAVARAMYKLARRMEPTLNLSARRADDDDDPPAAAMAAGRRR